MKLARLPVAGLDGPRGVPFLGPMGNLMRFFGDPIKHMLALSARYGEVAPLARGDAAVVCAFGPTHTRTVLSDSARFHNMAEAPIVLPPDSAAARFNLNLTNQNGDAHRTRRRSVMPLFERAAIAGYRGAMVAEIAARPLEPGRRCDAFATMSELSVAIAMRCLFGVTDRDAKVLGALGVEYLQLLIDPKVLIAPFDVPGLPYRRYLRTAAALEARILALIAERRGGDDVLSRLAASGELSDPELVAQTALFFIAGYETTASTLAWTLMLLAQHPDELDAVTAELETVLAGRTPEVEELAKLEVLDRVVHESMRLLPAAPLCFMRRATEAFALGAHELPAGSLVVTSALVTHRDPTIYPEPARFRPDRWRDLTPSTYAYLPFGAGPRRCIGAGFAAQAIRLILATLLQRVRPQMVPNAVVSRRVRGIVLGPRRDIAMELLAPRARAQAVRLRGDIHELVDLPTS